MSSSAEIGIVLGERTVPRAQFDERCARAATALAGLGVGAGDAVALLLRNDIAFLEATYAAARLAAYSVPVNWHFREDEVAHVVRDSGAKAVVCHADLLPLARAAAPPGVPVLAVSTPPELAEPYGVEPAACKVPSDAVDWDPWVDNHAPFDGPAAAAPIAMLYTSGTTGKPKGVRRRPPSADDAALLGRIARAVFGIRPDMRSVVCTPLYHAAGNSVARRTLDAGGHLVLQPRFDAEGLLALVERHRITHLAVVPTIFVRLLRLPPEVRSRYDLGSLVHVMHAAAPCPPDVKRQVIEWFGPIVHEYYGATELGFATHCTSEEWLEHPGTVGKAVEGAELRIVGDDGRTLPDGEIGEVYVRAVGPAFAYHGRADNPYDADGFVSCGDVGYLGDGYLYLCDRATDMIVSGGVNIYPAEIEAALVELAGVRDCAVFGVPDDDFGEVVAAVVEAEPDARLTADAVRAHVRTRLAAFKAPKVVDIRHQPVRDESGKLLRRALREPYWVGRDRRI